MAARRDTPPADPRRMPLGTGTPAPVGDSLSPLRTAAGAEVVVRRSRRRKTGLSAFWEQGRVVVAVPARMSVEDEPYWIHRMVSRLEAEQPGAGGTRRIPHSDTALLQRCGQLSATYLGARAVPASVRWVTNQRGRWGSATTAHRTIRISHQVQGMPDWVLDYVLLHELAHLIHPNHSAAFWAELASYPHLRRAEAFLEGVAFATARIVPGSVTAASGCDVAAADSPTDEHDPTDESGTTDEHDPTDESGTTAATG